MSTTTVRTVSAGEGKLQLRQPHQVRHGCDHSFSTSPLRLSLPGAMGFLATGCSDRRIGIAFPLDGIRVYRGRIADGNPSAFCIGILGDISGVSMTR